MLRGLAMSTKIFGNNQMVRVQMEKMQHNCYFSRSGYPTTAKAQDSWRTQKTLE